MKTRRFLFLALTCLTATTHAAAPPPEKKSKLGDTTVLENKSSGLTEQSKVVSFKNDPVLPKAPAGLKRPFVQVAPFKVGDTNSPVVDSATTVLRTTIPGDWFSVITADKAVKSALQLSGALTRLQCTQVNKKSGIGGFFDKLITVNGQPVTVSADDTTLRIDCEIALELGEIKTLDDVVVTNTVAKAQAGVTATDTVRNLGLQGGKYTANASTTKTKQRSKVPSLATGDNNLQMTSEDEKRVLRFVIGEAMGKLLKDYQAQTQAAAQ